MKINWNFFAMGVLLFTVIGLYIFANHRNNRRHIEKVNISFIGDQNFYLSHEGVQNLLIQKLGNLENLPKEKLVLNAVEKLIESNEMVKKAHVYLTIKGELRAKIEQRKPIGRVEGVAKYYVDEDGKRMPLSNNHSARVPLVTGNVTEQSLGDVHDIITFVNRDDFLKKNVIGIHVTEDLNYLLKFRMDNFVVDLGRTEEMPKKFNNFKAFYSKAYKDKTLSQYSRVSLEFNNQVVCTKI
ncbi:cell division protein FtsQ [Arenibacter nanhaiticus]|uniref:Cell division protein FtsQ n=1 Tax=Arenibacter nanhaiticus TaxID=558155 RepID=A0A1M6HNU9_9FLAO|nr:cell division protein FtsQ/DivIB [Arenibacter nanhaiticus]SHJ23850.1 cell division protein FtsQ [Arenibacter nanhaiticus]